MTSQRPSPPAMGPWVPAGVVHVACVGVATTLCLLALPSPFWRGVALLLAIGTVLAPQVVAGGWLLLLLGLSQLWRAPLATDGVFHALLAGVPLLHLLTSVAQVLPWNSRLAPAALGRPLRRYLALQLVVQPLAVAALLVLERPHRTVPALSLVSALQLAGIAAALMRCARPTT